MARVKSTANGRARAVFVAMSLTAFACSNGESSNGGDAGAMTDDAGPDAAEIDVIGDAGFAPFQQLATAAGVQSNGGLCVAAEDFDGDGHPDLLLATLFDVTADSITLYLNDGSGKLTAKPIPLVKFAQKGAGPGACAVGDLDADGKVDIVLSAFGGTEAHVLRNMGSGAFQDVQTLSTTIPNAYSYLGIALADLDADGWLDLVVGLYEIAPAQTDRTCESRADGYACYIPAPRCLPPPLVYRNSGNGMFDAPVSITSASDCGPANVNALAITDYDGDGLLDVFVANDWGINRFYVNGAGMKFHDIFPTLGAKPFNSAMGAIFEDFDLDGRLDMYVSDFGSDQFYLGGANASIATHAVDWGVAAPTQLHSGWAPLGEDFDSDGFSDVFVSSAAFVTNYRDLATVGLGGQIGPRVQFDLLLHGENGHGFSPQWIRQETSAEPYAPFGATAVADFDGDGKLDIAESIGYPMRFQLLHNASPTRHWIQVRLHGHAPNVDGLGATVSVARAGKPVTKRLVTRSRGSLGSSWSTLHFGLGDATAIDHIDVRWPSGTTQTIAAPPIDAPLTVNEP